MADTVYLDGEYLPRRDARVSVDDRGFLFGDGVYEVIRALDGVLFEPAAHALRMAGGLQALGIALAAPGPRRLLEVAGRLLRENGLLEGEAIVYMQVTRGAAPRRHAFPDPATPPTVYVAASRFQPLAELHGRGGAAITQPDARWARCNIKSVNLLPNVLAKQCATEAGAFEAILVRDGFVTEGSSTNVFGVEGGCLRTHPLGSLILPGVTRAVILELASALGLQVKETPIRFAALGRMDELFVAGTTTDVLPIVTLDGVAVGGGEPGPVTRAVQDAFAARLRGIAAPSFA